ncbi:MAG: DMT family transporter [Betaproteobacteria bacterium]
MLPDPFRTQRGAMAMLALTCLLWGGNYIASKVVVAESPPFTAAFVRFVFATLLVLALYALTPGARWPRREEWKNLAILGCAFFLYNLFFYSGLKATTSANAALLAATSPVITAVASAVSGKERVRVAQALGLAASFTGVTFVVLKEGLRLNPGDVLVIASSCIWSFYTLFGQRTMATLSPLAVTAFAWVVSTILLFPAALLERHTHGWFVFSTTAWWNLAYVVMFSSVACFTWWYKGVSAVGPTRASVFLNLIPLTGLVLSPLLMKERLTLRQLLGAALILGGVYLVAHYPARIRAQLRWA